MMLKKLIPAAALLALAGAAQAQVSIYGLVDLSYGWLNPKVRVP
jgi:predicted porin